MPTYNGAREKTGIYYDNPYDPKKEYYFVDYHCAYDCRWVRSPYRTWEEVIQIVKDLNGSFGFDIEGQKFVRFPQDLRITPERELARLHQVFNEETNQYEDDIINYRTYLFDGRYDIDEKWTGVKSLNKTKDETLEEWKERVAIAKKELKEARSKQYEQTIESVSRIKQQRREQEAAEAND